MSVYLANNIWLYSSLGVSLLSLSGVFKFMTLRSCLQKLWVKLSRVNILSSYEP